LLDSGFNTALNFWQVKRWWLNSSGVSLAAPRAAALPPTPLIPTAAGRAVFVGAIKHPSSGATTCNGNGLRLKTMKINPNVLPL
jgi:hypothetical protein